ncbi:LysM peptidoglycan-binding domain-containing protein [Parerythrobacter jejuensis]|uniref:LysM peptidoglycan-binding domain-containing protein n=1 Tax=Parerythrobacter jejuensis TaxID=795812 RepID=A0A845AUN9_9SPHN|nr:LysM peptidoglycan-binding domain-containing protein [Parerythrobacter jejuensis]MXP30257.1 LysM peptidoglycan-binding domain-containing protein [Parerythrobacter jejuensis]MXP33017.1 LysM peptidoglycan-binding domain-containing protein [Parerythrobacter jejuensis]
MTAIFTGLGSGLERSSANVLGAAGQIGGASLGRAGEKVSVNAATGNLVINRQDEFLTGRGLDIGISRTYNSLAELSDGDNGDQWQQSTTRRVFGLSGSQNGAGSTIKRQGGDGASITYTWDSGLAAYVSSDGAGAYDQLKKVGSQWVWTDGATQVSETYSAYGSNSWRIVNQKDSDGYGLSFTYSGAKLSKVTTANGEFTQYHWSGNNISKIVTSYGSTLTRTYYGYDGQNRLTSVSTDLSEKNNSLGSDKYVVNYTYHGNTKRVATISQTDGSSLAMSYDGSGRITSLTQTVASGDTRVTQLAYGSGVTTVTHADGTTNNLYYDSKKQLTQINYVGAASGQPVTFVKFTYDSKGNVTTVTDQNGKVTTYQYHSSRVTGSGHRGNATRIIDANNNQVDRWYDANNNLVKEGFASSSDTSGNATHYTRFAYDGENHLRYRISATGDVTEFRYTTHGLLQYEIEYPEHGYPVGSGTVSESQMNSWRDGLGDKSSTKIAYHTYDARGNKARIWNYGYATSTGGASNAEGYSRTYFTYDQAGKLLSTYDGSQIAQTYVYDGMGRLKTSTDLAGGTTNIVFQDANSKTVVTTASGHVSTSTFNKAGELISQLNSGSYDTTGTSSYKYDKMGRVRMETDETGFKTYYLYDKLGRKVADINHYGHITEYRYDKAGRVNASVSFAYGVSSANLTTLANPNNTLQMSNIRPAGHSYDVWQWHVYDAKGRVIQTIDGAGGTSKFEYDKADRLVKTTNYFNKLSSSQLSGFKNAAPTAMVLPSANSKDSIARSFYSRSGQLIGNLDGEGYLSEIVYDRAGQKVQEIAYAKKTSSSYWAAGTFSQLRSSAAPTSAANRRVHHVYDGQGQLRYSVSAQGVVSSLSYNIAGKLTKTVVHAATISTSDFTYDNVKAKVAAIANGTNDRTATINYNSRGQVAYSTDVSGLRTTFTYDNRGQVTKTVVGTGSTARTTRSWYTAQGSLRFMVDAEGYVRRYDYDKEDRLTREVTWSNKVTATDSTTISQINSLANGAGSWTDVRYTYDAAGRRNSMYDGEGNRTVWGWHRTGLLADEYTGYTDKNNATTDRSRTHHVYDGAGQLIRKYEAYGTPERADTYYYYDGLGNLTSTRDPNGKTTSFTHDETGRVLTSTNAAGGITRFEYNAFGDVVKTTDPRGNSTYSYYDNLGRLTKTRDAENYVTETNYTVFSEVASVTRRHNRTTSAVSTTTPPSVSAHSKDATTSFQYDKRGLVTRSTDAEGHFETYTYDAYGNRITARAKSATTSKVAGGTTTYAYDKRGLLVAETLPVKSYAASGAVAASTVTNTFAYDARGNRITMVEAQGLSEQRTTQYVYDKANRLKETIGQTFIGKTPREYIYYDARGNITETKDAGGGRTIYFYDDLNRKVVEINAAGTYSKYTYDKNGNVTQTRVYANAVSLPSGGGSLSEAPGAPSGGSRTTNYTYDNLNRMLTSAIAAGVQTGYFNGSSWVATASAIQSSYQYDANGNVVKMTDPNGRTTWSYYDKAGRKTSQVDGERYRTDWTYDSEGNVTRERRFVNRAATPNSVTTPPSVSSNGSLDRITDFTYDKVGNRETEKRLNVLKHNGSGAHVNTHSQISYLYNGLGQVTRKTEATAEQTNYKYDAGGRLIEEKRASFASHSGTVTPEVDYYYNGVGDLARTVAAGQSGVSARVTTYGYDGGKLRSLTDAEGFTRYFLYDNAGRQTHDYYKRIKSDGTYAANYDGVLTSYDALGRATQKWQSTHNGSTWVDSGPRAVTTYNAFGETASVAVGGRTQTQNKFDDAGRVWATTSGDGVWKFLGYDKNGNQTIAITSAGLAFGSGTTFQYAYDRISRSDVNATYTQYDKRNQAIKVVEEGRQLGGSTQTLNTSRTYNAFGETLTETNANGSVIAYTYNNMGRLIKSVNPTVQVTNENGSTQWIKPTEDYYYDASGRLVASRDANGTYANGSSSNGGAKTANTGNLTKLTLLAGTGYGGSQALVTRETFADGGIKQTKFDIHGDARTMIDQINRTTTQSFDKMGRVTQVNHAAGLVEHFAYDGLGQQIKKWNNLLVVGAFYDPYTGASSAGSPEVATTDYDTQGRIISQKDFGGDVTTHSFTWNAGLSTTNIGTFGGWTEVTTYANGKTMTENSDLFGRMLSKNDLGNNTTTYVYDVAGRIRTSSVGGLTSTFNYFNTGQQSSVVTGTANAGTANTNWTRETASYTYDKLGQRLTEHLRHETAVYTPGQTIWYNPYEPDFIPATYNVTNKVVKNATAVYDNLGRVTNWSEAGSATSPAATTAYKYDASGNIRRTTATYKSLDANGAASSTNVTKDYWFRFDSMNRLVTDRGTLSGGQIIRGNSVYGAQAGKDILYNKAGERIAVLTTDYTPGTFNTYTGFLPGTFRESRESYTYDLGGRLKQINVSFGTTVAESAAGSGVPAGTIPAAPINGTRRSVFAYDLMGRQTAQTDYEANGTTIAFSRSATYNSKNQLTSDTTNTKRGSDIFRSTTTYNYGAGASYALGSVVSQSSINYKNNNSSQAPNSSTTNTFYWRDGAVQATIKHKPNTSQSTQYTTTFYYDGMGRLTRAYVGDYYSQNVTFTNDEYGQIIRRDETTTSNSTGAPHEVWYRYGGRQLGYTGNNGTSDVSTSKSIQERQITPPTTPGVFRNGATIGSSYADFASSYDPLNSYNQGAGGGSYTVNKGDTLQSIAQSVYGDANLWYKIAQLNGISGSVPLIEGQRINLPTGVVRSSHNSGTITPYNPAEAIGDLTPTTSAPPKKGNKCGVFGLVLLAVVAIAVTVVTAGAAIAAATPGLSLGGGITAALGGTATATVGVGAAAVSTTVSGGLIGTFGVAGGLAIGAGAAAAGSIVSQGIGVATGIQQKFSWKAVGMAALGSFVSAGIGEAFGGGGWLAAAGRGAASSAITQGVGVATGLQNKFDWAGVAAAGVGAGVGHLVGGDLPSIGTNNSFGNYAAHFGTSAARLISSAATRSLVTGTNFGDNVIAGLPDVIAQTVTDLIFNGVSRSTGPIPLRTFEREIGSVYNQFEEKIVNLEQRREEALAQGDEATANRLDAEIEVQYTARSQSVSNRYQELAVNRYGMERAINMRMADIIPEGSRFVRFLDDDNSSSQLSGGDEVAEVDEQGRVMDVIVVVGQIDPNLNVNPESSLGRTVVNGLAYTQEKVENWGPLARGAWVVGKTAITGGAGPVLGYAVEKGAEQAIPHLPPAILEPIARAGQATEDFVGGRGGGVLLDTSHETVVRRDRSAVAWGAEELLGISLTSLAVLATRYLRGRRGRGPTNTAELANALTNNPRASEVVLGKVDDAYQDVARNRGATFFGTSDEQWDAFTDQFDRDGMREANQIFMANQIAQRKSFTLVSNPTNARGMFGMEVGMLRAEGYSFRRSGNYWEAFRGD